MRNDNQLSQDTKDTSGTAAAARRLAAAEGVFYLLGGVWPIIHMRSFEAVTGPKVDRWLVRTTGGLLGVIGGVLCSAARSGRISPEMRVLGAGSAAVLATIDVTYVAKKRISPVYLLDAVAQLAIVAAWMLLEGNASPEGCSEGLSEAWQEA